MVGYHPGETLSEKQKLFAGVVSGVITRFLTQPLDLVKMRTQLRRRTEMKPLLLWRISRSIFREEGLTAFWQGHCVAQLHSIMSVSAQLYSYEWCTQHIVQSTSIKESYKTPLVFATGVFAGCVSATVGMPLDVMRVRQVLVKTQYGGFYRGIKNIYKQGGILCFFEGWTASMMQIGPAAGINFCVFRWVQPRVLRILDGAESVAIRASGNYTEKTSNLLLASSIAGITSGFISKTLTYPFDLAKRRLQISTHKRDRKMDVPSTAKHLQRCYSLLLCLTDAFKYNGLAGLYQGWAITVIKAQVTSLITFTTYEVVCHLIRDYNYGHS